MTSVPERGKRCSKTTVCVLSEGHGGLCQRPGGVKVQRQIPPQEYEAGLDWWAKKNGELKAALSRSEHERKRYERALKRITMFGPYQSAQMRCEAEDALSGRVTPKSPQRLPALSPDRPTRPESAE